MRLMRTAYICGLIFLGFIYFRAIRGDWKNLYYLKKIGIFYKYIDIFCKILLSRLKIVFCKTNFNPISALNMYMELNQTFAHAPSPTLHCTLRTSFHIRLRVRLTLFMLMRMGPGIQVLEKTRKNRP